MSSTYLYDSRSRLMSDVKVLHPVHSASISLPARVDTGADITLIPEAVKNKLGLFPAGKVPLTQAKGGRNPQDTYFVGLTFENLAFMPIKVITTGLSYAVIGLDVLNRFRLMADGKAQTFTLEDP